MRHSESKTDPGTKRDGEHHKTVPYRNASLPVSERVEDLLSRMTLYEKIGQMTQLDITLINTTGEQRDVELDPEKARDFILNHHIGSFLNGEAVSAGAWYEFMKELARIAVEESRLGIPIIYGIDHIHGASYLEGATYFPQSLNLAATFNPEHAQNTGKITALESADLGHHWIFAPVLDLGVNPLWPRLWETFGEDPYLAGVMGAAYVTGLQDNDDTAPFKQAATGKHFLGYSDPRSGWDRTPAHLPMQQIHEFHRPAFQKAVDAGLKTIMTNSGEVNGIPVPASHELLTVLLREKMGFDGVIVTDWDDIGKLTDFHYTADSFKEATRQSVMAGIDMSMTPLHLDFNTSLLELVEEGQIPEERIDESVRRILRLKFELGLFEHPLPRNDRFDRIGHADNRQKALDAARESIILLKNDNELLPLCRPAKIGVMGPSADSKRNLSGGWTIAWQGGHESQYPEEMRTVYSALKDSYPDAEIVLFGRDDIPDAGNASDSDRKSFLDKVDGLDAVIYAGGEKPYCEFAGNINDINLPQKQIDELGMLAQSETPVILVLIQGRPRRISDILESTDAILYAGLPGFEGARAIADVISGKVNPSGKMPVTYPMEPNHFLPYNHKKSNLYFFDPARANQIIQGELTTSTFPFGFGLSYTTFEYSDLKLSADSMDENGSIEATVTVTNTGRAEGKETVLWFISTHTGRITRPVKELKHFERTTLKPGASAALTFVITPDQLSYPDENGEMILEKGSYSVRVAELKKDFKIIA
ncbi:glycoside hydrolase family 3 N-terminal domain-containing protein [Balneolales bacterium ANBcel1]|nr:glycoside hydrolase family 3 N-terminal domain-containing protein [Balneolales bacterium ANBcel1]